MVDDADNDVTAFEQPDRERVYRTYLETCRRLGIKPTAQGRAEALIKEWTKALAADELIRQRHSSRRADR